MQWYAYIALYALMQKGGWMDVGSLDVVIQRYAHALIIAIMYHHHNHDDHKNDDQIIGRYGPNEMGPVAFCRISDLGLALAQTTLTPRRFRRINILQ